jgi:hypothetical protein
MEKINFLGLPNCRRLTDGKVELVVTTDTGPRIMRFGFPGGKNMLGEWPDKKAVTKLGEFRLWGGHRLWAAPELEDLTYGPDNGPVGVKSESKDRVHLVQPVDLAGLEKEIAITLSDSGAVLTHRITNRRKAPVELAPWALTIMRGLGTAIIPAEPYFGHDERFLPARQVVLWHYTDMADQRITWGRKYVLFRSVESAKEPTKIGFGNRRGWAAYAVDGTLFVKKFPWVEGGNYPDFGCNCEFYTEGSFLEVESLGPLRTLNPGETVEHVEEWKLFADAGIGGAPSEIEKALDPLLARAGIK